MKKLIPFLLIIFLFYACEKSFQGSVYTIAPTNISRTSITCGGYIKVEQGNPTIISCGIAYSLDSAYAFEGVHVPSDSLVQKGAFKCTLTDLIPDTTYYLRAYFELADGFHYAFDDDVEVRTKYTLGHSGPAGGYIINLHSGSLHGIEISPEDLGIDIPWGCQGLDIPDAMNDWNGYGDYNTNAILFFCDDTLNAASYCDNYSLNGYDDWYLPTTHELNAAHQYLFQQDRGNLHPFFSYWTSTQYDLNHAWTVSMNNGGAQYYSPKSTPGKLIRAVRYF